MIDKEQPLDVCKIEARKQIEHRIEHDSITKTKALQIVAEESGIPYTTLKQWFYPTGNDNRKKKRRKEKAVCHNIQKTPVVCHDTQETPVVCHDTQTKVEKVLTMITPGELLDIVSKAKIIGEKIGGSSAYDTLNLALHVFDTK